MQNAMLDLDSQLREISGARLAKDAPQTFLRTRYMKKAKTKPFPKGTSKTPSTSRKPVDIEIVRQNVAALIGASAVRMVETTIAEVDKGHYAAMKYLFELVGLFPGNLEPAAASDDVLAKTLLRRLGLPEEIKAGESVTKDTASGESDATQRKTDTVE
jgi:hypothetical protein